MELNNTWYALSRDAVDPVATVHIYDEIGGWGIQAIDLVNELKALDEVDELNVHINSPGGSITEGLAIYNVLKSFSGKVIIQIDGLAASMASVIAMAGDEVHMAENAYFMIHNPWTLAVGDAEELRKSADLLDKMRETLINSYSRTGKDREELIAMLDAETWLTAAEALEHGFIDSITLAQKAAALAADFDMVAQFKSMPTIEAPAEPVEEPVNVADLQSTIQTLNESLAAIRTENADLLAKVDLLTSENKNLEAAITEQGDRHAEQLEQINAKHSTELEAAKLVTDEAVAKAAAELTAAQGIPPVAQTDLEDEESSKMLDSDEYWAEWKRQPVAKRHEWHMANKDRLKE